MRSSIRSRAWRSGRPALSRAASSWLKTTNSWIGIFLRRRRPAAESCGGAPRRLTSKTCSPRLASSLRSDDSSLAFITSSRTRPSGVPTRQRNCILLGLRFLQPAGVAVAQGQHDHQGLGARLAAGEPQARRLVEPQVQIRMDQRGVGGVAPAPQDLEIGQLHPLVVGDDGAQPEAYLIVLADRVGDLLPLLRDELRLRLHLIDVIGEE